MTKQNKIELTICYFTFMLMGVFHYFNIFSRGLNNLYSPLFVVTFFWIIIKIMMQTDDTKNISIFSFIVFLFSLIISLLVFRNDTFVQSFHFGTILKPQILSIPLTAGFIWLNAIFVSTALIQRFHSFSNFNVITKSLLIGLSFLVFDIYFEPAAGRLGFWYWGGASIPLLNYAVWFCFGTLMGFIGLKMKVFTEQLPAIALHLYIAQVLFFLTVFFS